MISFIITKKAIIVASMYNLYFLVVNFHRHYTRIASSNLKSLKFERIISLSSGLPFMGTALQSLEQEIDSSQVLHFVISLSIFPFSSAIRELSQYFQSLHNSNFS